MRTNRLTQRTIPETKFSTLRESDGCVSFTPMGENFDEVLNAIADAERGPTDEDISNAPCVNHYRLERTGECAQRIYGQVRDHPEIDDPYVTTTPLLGFEPDAGWARTRSRWYRLGPDWLLPNPEERDEMARAIQRLLKAARKWVIDEISDDRS
ncbi:MAG: DUF6634 family protein [Litoreibacter sp.]